MDGLMTMNFSVPLSVTVSSGGVQLTVFRFVFCCKVQPDHGEGQETVMVES